MTRVPFVRCFPLALALALALAGAPGCEACDACDRSTQRSTYQEPDERIVLPGGGVLLKERPIIPEDQRANCRVCPDWCTQADLRPLPPGTVIATYRRHALIYAGRTGESRWPDGWGTLEQMGCIVAGGGPLLQQRFVALLHDPDPAIRWPVAVHTLQYGIDKSSALAALRAMVGRVLDDGTADGPDGADYASRAHFLLIDHEDGGPVELQ